MISLFDTSHKLNKAAAEIDECLDEIELIRSTLSNIESIEYYACADFEAEERTQWIVHVVLKIVGMNDEFMTIHVDKDYIYKQPRYSYNDWEKQRDSDRDAAQKLLVSMGEKWGCKIIPIGE